MVVGKETWHKFRHTYNLALKKIEQELVGTFQQFPLALGWAITIHKSQGLTLDLGGGTFASGQLYVTLSHAKAIDGITLTKPIAMKDVKVDPTILEFYRQIAGDH